MNLAAKRLLTATALLFIFALSLYLRMYGMDWSFRDGENSFHPDERHYQHCASVMNPQWLTAEEQSLSVWEKIQVLIERNLVPQPGGQALLEPVNYNYGTMPLHMYLGYQGYLRSLNPPGNEITFIEQDDGQIVEQRTPWKLIHWLDPLSVLLLLVSLWIGVRLFWLLSRDLHTSRGLSIPVYKDPERIGYFVAAMLLPLAGLGIALWSPNLWVDLSRYRFDNILLIGRLMTAWCGALTVLVIYLLARDAFGKLAGLLSALMLSTAMLHVQTSHFATADVILGFFVTCAIYAFFKVSQSPRWYWYFLAMMLTGFAVASKWSGLMLIGMLWVSQAIATFGNPKARPAERWIHTVLLAAFGFALLFFLRAATSVEPSFHIAISAYWETTTTLWWLWLILTLVTLIASFFLLQRQLIWDGKTGGVFSCMVSVFRPWVWFLLSIPFGVGAFFFGSPMAFYDAGQFASNLIYQTRLNGTGDIPIWYTIQYIGTPSIWYSLDNLFYPSLDYVTAFVVVAGCLYSVYRMISGKGSADAFLCAWVIPAFIVFSSVHSKFPRYMIIVLPIMMVLGGRFLAEWIRAFPHWIQGCQSIQPATVRWVQRSGVAITLVALLCGMLYGTAYVRIYDEPHTLVQADRWIRDTLLTQTPRPVVATNNVDELGGYGRSIGFHYGDQVNMPPAQQAEYYAEQFSSIDYLFLQSKRPYGSTLQAPDDFPMINQMFRALFAEQLGFRVLKVINNPPRIGPLELTTDLEDETARIYDHPKIIIFEKVETLSKEAIRERILNPPAWVRSITREEILSLQEDRPVFAQPTSFSPLRWYIAIQVLGALAFLLMFPLLTRLPDRGWSVAKPVGIAMFAWGSWILASIGMWDATFNQRWFVFALMAAGAGSIACVFWQPLLQWIRHNWKQLVVMEILFLVLWSVFLGIRVYHPANHEGEKPMNVSFINATYRAMEFPPEDPWYSGNPVNYYYYGHMMYSTVAEWSGMAPQYVLNVAGTSVTALVGLAVFGLVFAFTRKRLLALLGVWLAVFLTPLTAFMQGLSFASGNSSNWYNLERIFSGSVGREGQALPAMPTWAELYSHIPNLYQWAYTCMLGYLGQANEDQWRFIQSLSYHDLFWPSRTVIPGSAANEYPFWSHLFLDFHAHMLVWPFTLAFLMVLYGFFSRHHKETNLCETLGLSAILALLLGTITCTNTWDLPGAGIALILAVLLKFWRESDLVAEHGTRHVFLSPATLQSLARLPIAPILGIFVLSIVMLFPFHFSFESRVNSIGLMSEGQTSPYTWVLWWAPMLFPLIAAVLGWAFFRPDGGFSITRSVLFTGGFVTSVLSAVFLQWFFRLRLKPGFADEDVPLFAWLYASDEYYTLVTFADRMPLDFTILGLMLPFLAMIFFGLWNRRQTCSDVFALLVGFIGLGLSLGIEMLYIKEGWGIPLHRWNTSFKFNLQVWMYLAIFAPVAILFVWRHLGAMGRAWGGGFGLVYLWAKRVAFVSLFLFLLLLSLPMTVIMPAQVMFTDGARFNRDALQPLPTLDGSLFLKERNYGTWTAVHWFNRFVEGTPTILEMPDGYYNSVSRFSVHTGLPTVIGWAHHVGERIADGALRERVKYDRTVDADTIYLTRNKEEARELLSQYGVEYVVYGDLEATFPRNFGSGQIRYDDEVLTRMEQWSDLYELVFRVGNTSVFRVIQSLNPALSVPSQTPSALTSQPQPGVSMFEGSEGGTPGQFRQPRAITTDANGYAYVADTFNHRIQVFRPGGTFVWEAGTEGSANLQFREPNELDIDPTTGNIYIADTWNGRIVLLDKFGTYMGATPNHFYGPRGVVYHPETQRVYVSDTGNHKIKVLQNGDIIDEWGVEPQSDADSDFNEPIGLDIDVNGNIVVCDTFNFRVKVYTPDGDLLRIFPIQTLGVPGTGFESHVACAPDGSMYLTDPWEGSVHVYSAEGELLRRMNRDLRGEPLQRPVGITLYGEDRVLVTDIQQNRVVAVQ